MISAYRIELWGDEIESLSQIDPLFGTVKQKLCAAADLSQDPLRGEAGDARRRGAIRSWKSWRGGKANSRSRGEWWRRSACISGRGSIWR